jgi:hypothetical protein
MNDNLLHNGIAIIVGVIFVLCSGKFAYYAAECQRKAFHREGAQLEFKVGFILGGLILFISGVWSFLVP